MAMFLGYPDSKTRQEIEKRHLPVPEDVFETDESGNVVIDETHVNANGCVQCFATPNEDGTLTLTFND